MKNQFKTAGITLVLCTLMILSNAIFAQQNNSGRGIPFVGPEPQPIAQQPVEQIPTQPQQQPITIINNWPDWQRPEPRPRIIYTPSRPRVITQPAEPAKKDTIIIVQQSAMQQSTFLSDNGIIWCIIVLGLLLFGILGYLIAGRRRYGNCCGYRGLCNGTCDGRDCRSRDINVQGHIDHGHNGIPTKVTHVHTHKHEGEISLVMPLDSNKAEPRPPVVDQK